MTEEANASPKHSTDHKAEQPNGGYSAHEEKLIYRQVLGLVFYYLIFLFVSFWFLFDVWSGNLTVMRLLGVDRQSLQDPLLRTIGFVIVGGVFGSILFQIRVLFKFYLKEKTYDRRWLGKYISAPWESAAMALVVLSLIRGGVALFGGSMGTDVTSTNNFAAFGTGALVGFGMRDVVRWLGNIVENVFATNENPPPAPPA